MTSRVFRDIAERVRLLVPNGCQISLGNEALKAFELGLWKWREKVLEKDQMAKRRTPKLRLVEKAKAPPGQMNLLTDAWLDMMWHKARSRGRRLPTPPPKP